MLTGEGAEAPDAAPRRGPARVFYGRLRGKALRPNQARLIEDLLPRLAVPGIVRAAGAQATGAGDPAGPGAAGGRSAEAERAGGAAGLAGDQGAGADPAGRDVAEAGPADARSAGAGVADGDRAEAGSADESAAGAGAEEGGAAAGAAVARPGATPGDAGPAPFDPVALFGDARPVWLEIGFGGGEHLAHQAASNPGVGVIGAEPFVNGVAMALARIEAQGLGNVRIHAGDARDLLDQTPAGALARVFLLYPDPWPKTRHWERRFMSPENLRVLARVMAPGAELRLASDIPDYVRHAVRAAEAAGGFVLEGGPEDWARPWADWKATRYEAKARREGRGSQYLTFRRL